MVKNFTDFVPNDSYVNCTEENDEVPVAGFGCKGHTRGDFTEVHSKFINVVNVSLLAFCKGKKERLRS